MKNKIIYGLFGLLLGSGSFPCLLAQYHVVAYLPVYGLHSPDISKIPFKKITHLNLAFLRVDSAANINAPVWMDSIIQAAHIHHVKVLGSIGGGNAPAYYKELLKDVQRPLFTENLVTFIQQHQLDGIDVDLEGNLIDEHYEIFLRELSQKLKRKKKLLTAAIATWISDKITNAALAYLDFLNIMSYDKTGPWTPNRAGPHAPISMAASDISYWSGKRRIPKKKIILGVPFYGYRFAPDGITGISFAEILTRFPGAQQKDSLIFNDKSSIYYNGIETIRAKTKLAMEKAGGVMIWQLLQDAEEPNSLLGIIDDAMHSNRKK